MLEIGVSLAALVAWPVIVIWGATHVIRKGELPKWPPGMGITRQKSPLAFYIILSSLIIGLLSWWMFELCVAWPNLIH